MSAALDQLAVEAAACTRCRLADERQQVVFGVGSSEADLLFDPILGHYGFFATYALTDDRRRSVRKLLGRLTVRSSTSSTGQATVIQRLEVALTGLQSSSALRCRFVGRFGHVAAALDAAFVRRWPCVPQPRKTGDQQAQRERETELGCEPRPHGATTRRCNVHRRRHCAAT